MDSLISVIVPVYNVEEYIEGCLNSLLNQTYSNLEIILVDDGSTDKSGFICDDSKKKDSRIHVIHKQNGGVSSARNMGLEYCHGEYVAFVDSDDILNLNYFEILLNNAQKYDADISSCSLMGTDGVKVFPLDKLSLDNNEEKIVFLQDDDFEFFQWYSINAPFCKIFQKDLIRDIRFDTSLCIGEDLVFYIKALKKSKKCIAIGKCLYHYTIRENSAMHNNDYTYKFSEIVAWENVCRLLDCKSNAYRRASEKTLFYCYVFFRRLIKTNNKLNSNDRKFIIRIFRSKRKYKYILGNGFKFNFMYIILILYPELYFYII